MNHDEPSTHAGDAARRSRGVPRPVAVSLLAVPVAATVGAFGLPALAGTGADDAAPRLTTVARTAAAAASASPVEAARAARAAADKKRSGAAAPASSDEEALKAYFAQGYDYDDAARLAKLWNTGTVGGDLSAVKIGAGRNLIAGRPLETRPQDLPTVQAMVQAFHRAGYGYQDAVLLARLWGGIAPTDAKAHAGQMLLAGAQPPTRPGQTPATVSRDAALEAYLTNGYGYDDAARLATLWHRDTSGDLTGIKVEAGRKILAGSLPVHR